LADADGGDADPQRWLGDTPMLGIGDDKLRLRVKTVTQFSRNDTERLLSICRYVASIPFNVRPLTRGYGPRVTLRLRKTGGWTSKAALFIAMLRVAGFPARVRMIKVGPEIYRGLAKGKVVFPVPVVEVWTDGRWVVTDNYVYDPPYLAAAREAVQNRGWRSGFGVHLEGQTDWDGVNDALVMIVPERSEGRLPEQYLGVYDDPMGLARENKVRSKPRWLITEAQHLLMSVRIQRQIRLLRQEAGG
jgi:hypothetical protein